MTESRAFLGAEGSHADRGELVGGGSAASWGPVSSLFFGPKIPNGPPWVNKGAIVGGRAFLADQSFFWPMEAGPLGSSRTTGLESRSVTMVSTANGSSSIDSTARVSCGLRNPHEPFSPGVAPIRRSDGEAAGAEGGGPDGTAPEGADQARRHAHHAGLHPPPLRSRPPRPSRPEIDGCILTFGSRKKPHTTFYPQIPSNLFIM